jgi:putative MATE family efflux protein
MELTPSNIISNLKLIFSTKDEQPYTDMSISKAIAFLSIPMVLEMSFEALFALVDAFFISKYVGIAGVALVGITESVMTLIYSLAWGLATAATAIIARRIGEKNETEGRNTTLQIILVSISLGLLIGLPAYFYCDEILVFMGASKSIMESGLDYSKLLFLSSPIVIMIFALGGALRGAGQALVAMKAVIIANMLNILLDYVFIVTLDMGMKGAALATIIGRSCGVAYQLYYLLKGVKVSAIILSLKPLWSIIKNILLLTTGNTSQYIIQSLSWVVMVRLITGYGEETVAGYTIAIRIIIFTVLPSWGLANTAATLLGQHVGANQIAKGIKTVWYVAFLNASFLGFVSLILFIIPETLLGFFNSNSGMIEAGALALKIFSVGYFIFGIGMVLVQAINGAGDSLTPTIFNIVCYLIIQIPIAYFLAESMKLEATGVYWSIVIAETIWTLIAVWYFRSGRWQGREV